MEKQEFERILDERLKHVRKENAERQRSVPAHLKLSDEEMKALEKDQLLIETVKLVNESQAAPEPPAAGPPGIEITALQHAAMTDNIGKAKVALWKGDDINDLGQWGATPLWEAARRGHLSMVQFLIKSGADVSVKSGSGVTALDVARENSQAEIVKLLTSYVGKKGSLAPKRAVCDCARRSSGGISQTSRSSSDG